MGRTGTPQAVLAPLTEAAIFLVATIGAGNDAEQATLDLLSDVSALTRSGGLPYSGGRADLCARDRRRAPGESSTSRKP
ncbi:MAG: Dyp-type peroxidase domain-containing protein [Acidimicrobiales bacterium]|jgi:hypothetical protein